MRCFVIDIRNNSFLASHLLPPYQNLLSHPLASSTASHHYCPLEKWCKQVHIYIWMPFQLCLKQNNCCPLWTWTKLHYIVHHFFTQNFPRIQSYRPYVQAIEVTFLCDIHSFCLHQNPLGCSSEYLPWIFMEVLNLRNFANCNLFLVASNFLLSILCGLLDVLPVFFHEYTFPIDAPSQIGPLIPSEQHKVCPLPPVDDYFADAKVGACALLDSSFFFRCASHPPMPDYMVF